ncbi:facilitated trehalose transporter Tret1-like [Macrosteles quadrilineatus]|uniref:facilitated trehalose transporter Tret1-like n=1 Tax=Macrosteles quadrilineatus TaxID=74068 RepID=UPI0023E12636|nr:facilitated trehalose transporter Tret1-like [Macrosteles quadrilineatus]XP_054268277.1 facilitated trehalose transporter Tret1-like [Macrosteles quadrilineatus]
MSLNKETTVDMDVLKALVDDSPNLATAVGATVEERVGGEAWYGSMAVMASPTTKKRRGSSLKQVLAALSGNLGTINTGMMFGFSAVTIPQLRLPESFIQITQEEASWIASLSSVSTPFGCILSGYLLDAIGRKRTIILTLMPMIIGWFLIYAASSIYMIYVGRLLVGLGAGMMGSPARVYTGEVTQPHLRGMLAAVASVGVSLGVTIQYIVGAFVSWNSLALFNGIVPSIGLMTAFFLPESPSWLLNQGKTEAARNALTRLRGDTCDIEGELQDLINFANKTNSNKKSSMKDTLRAILHPSALKPFLILASYFLIYQFSGVNPVTFYAVEIIQDSGADMNKYMATIVLGLVRLGFTVVSCIMMRRCGRRPLTFISSVFCGLSMFGLGYYMFLAEGWKEEGATAIAAWFPLLNLFIFMAASTIGYLVVPWVMIGELYPSKVRGIMGGMTTFVGHFCVFVVVKTFPFFQSLSKYGTFMMYGTVSLLGTIYFYLYLPETKGRTLQEIEEYFCSKDKGMTTNPTNNNNKPTIVKPKKDGSLP